MGDKYLQLSGLKKDGMGGWYIIITFRQDGRVSVLFAADVPCSGCISSLYRLIVVCEEGSIPLDNFSLIWRCYRCRWRHVLRTHCHQLSNEGSLACNRVYSETRVSSEDRWHSRLLLCVWQCHALSLNVVNDSGLSRPRIEHPTFLSTLTNATPRRMPRCRLGSELICITHIVFEKNKLGVLLAKRIALKKVKIE